MIYKALIFDLDGTAVQSTGDALPSSRVIQAVNKAREYVKVACATGRGAEAAKPVIQALGLTSPCIVAGGAQIIDPISFLPIWEVFLSKEKIRDIVEKISSFQFFIRGSDDLGPKMLAKQYTNITRKHTLYILGLTPAELELIVPVLKKIKQINIHHSTSWEAGKFSIQITHPDASKKKALEYWLTHEQIDPSQVIAIGDADNDEPLFELAGLKIAMGNSSQKLLDLADWIAPSIDDDGVVAAIKKFIL